MSFTHPCLHFLLVIGQPRLPPLNGPKVASIQPKPEVVEVVGVVEGGACGRGQWLVVVGGGWWWWWWLVVSG